MYTLLFYTAYSPYLRAVANLFIVGIQSLFDTSKILIKYVKLNKIKEIFLPHSKCFQGLDYLQLAGQI